jgi:hypothetical protein
MPLLTISQLYRGSQFYWWRKPEYPEKTTDLSQITDNLDYYITLTSKPYIVNRRRNLRISYLKFFLSSTVVPRLMRQPLLQWKSGLVHVREVVSFEGDNVGVFYHLRASEIWAFIRVAIQGRLLWWTILI